MSTKFTTQWLADNKTVHTASGLTMSGCPSCFLNLPCFSALSRLPLGQYSITMYVSSRSGWDVSVAVLLPLLRRLSEVRLGLGRVSGSRVLAAAARCDVLRVEMWNVVTCDSGFVQYVGF